MELPATIEDIDADDKTSPTLFCHYTKDFYTYLRELEGKYPIHPNHLQNQNVVTDLMRAALIDWLENVQKAYGFQIETFHQAVGIIDRYLQAEPNVPKDQLQLIGVTSLFIAHKHEEVIQLGATAFVNMTLNYTVSHINRCERKIMSVLGFRLGRPTTLHFLQRFLKAAHGTSKSLELAIYLVNCSLLKYSMLHYRPSELAAAAMYLSLYLLSGEQITDIWTPTLAHYSGYTFEHIQPIVQYISHILTNFEMSKFKAFCNEYLNN